VKNKTDRCSAARPDNLLCLACEHLNCEHPLISDDAPAVCYEQLF
jgi:hypothetical protein